MYISPIGSWDDPFPFAINIFSETWLQENRSPLQFPVTFYGDMNVSWNHVHQIRSPLQKSKTVQLLVNKE